jgi:hypothetical protein
MCVHTSACVCAYVHVRLYVHMCVRACAFVCARVCAVRACVCVLAGTGIGGSLRTITTSTRKSKTLDFLYKRADGSN